jgi:anion-transporting  ArsA/GET3 family ATPase
VLAPLPRVVFVLGKGGVGRSTVAASLGSALAARGERVLIVEWTVAEPIAPWFGLPPAGVTPREIEPGLSVANYELAWGLRAYFVDHLHLRRFYQHVIDGAPVRRLIEAAPGIAELMFLGQLWWLSTLAADEAGLCFDRIVVDAPATGHGASILRLPATLDSLGATGLLALEAGRVRAMMSDPAWTGAIVVALPEELAVEETLELVPKATRDLGRAPLAVLINRSVASLGAIGPRDAPDAPGALASLASSNAALAALAARLSPAARDALETLLVELRGRARREQELTVALAGRTAYGTLALDDALLLDGDTSPRAIVERLAPALGAAFGPGFGAAGSAELAKRGAGAP